LLASREGLGERGAQWTEVISWEPRAFVYHNFLVSNANANANANATTAVVSLSV
jgi:hypothetical protein